MRDFTSPPHRGPVLLQLKGARSEGTSSGRKGLVVVVRGEPVEPGSLGPN